MFATLKPSKSVFAFHNEQNTCSVSHSFSRAFKCHLADALTEPGRISGISFRKIACALQQAGLYIAWADRRATSERAPRSRGHDCARGLISPSCQASLMTPHSGSLGVDSWRLWATWQSPAHRLVCACMLMRTHPLRVHASSFYIYPVAVSVALRSVCRKTKLPPPAMQAV